MRPENDRWHGAQQGSRWFANNVTEKLKKFFAAAKWSSGHHRFGITKINDRAIRVDVSFKERSITLRHATHSARNDTAAAVTLLRR
ncbi:hypothetical protein CKO51_23280 [Rhodopirellula sp. SM50]|nr:hypothetical protein [Rhodopirellula sp. SM50]PAY17090.1 hypothetical protein CKO51_23280 [Rhodopirellula sp. SM50]